MENVAPVTLHVTQNIFSSFSCLFGFVLVLVQLFVHIKRFSVSCILKSELAEVQFHLCKTVFSLKIFSFGENVRIFWQNKVHIYNTICTNWIFKKILKQVFSSLVRKY